MEQFDKLREKRKKANAQFNLYKWYFVIAIVSVIAVFGIPLLGSITAVGVALPATFIGWCIFIFSKLSVVAINMMIFHSFMCQGKLNIKDHPKYLEACAILNRYGMGINGPDPKSPEVWLKEQYGTKGTFTAITTALSSLILTNAVLTFDWMAMIAYMITIVMGIVTGLFQQDAAEVYWTDQFWCYAKKVEKEQEEKKQQEANYANNE